MMIKLNDDITLYKGDMMEVLKTLPENSIDTCICDPPYHLTSIVKRFGKKDSAPAKFGEDGVFQRASAGFMGKCYDKETELLTEDGWIKIGEIVDRKYSGNFYSLNPDTNEIEMCKATEFMKYDFVGEMLHFTGRSIDLMVTPNHNLWISVRGVTGFKKADEVPGSFSMFNQGQWNGGDNPEFIEILGKEYPTKPFMKFLGIYLGDGCVVERKAQPEKQNFISLSAKKKREKEIFKECLTKLGVKFTQYGKQTIVYDKTLNKYLTPLGKALDKYIPKEYFSLSKDLLLELLSGLLETDGYVNRDRSCIQYFTSSEKLANNVQRLLLHCGISGTIGYREPKEQKILGVDTMGSGEYVVSVLQENKKLWFEKVDHKNGKRRLIGVPYDGFVYDVELEKNHILMARRNGKTIWSSNSWDGGDIAFRPETWAEVYRVLKPGAYLLAFGGDRTYHRLACAVEDAGFEIYGCAVWMHSQGFPKAYDISKGIDGRLGAEREIVGKGRSGAPETHDTTYQMSQQESNKFGGDYDITEPATPEAKLWEGYRTALKPAVELIVIAQKPRDGTYVDNALKWGVAGFNIEGARIPTGETIPINKLESWSGFGQVVEPDYEQEENTKGRYPANLLIDDSQEVWDLFPDTGKSTGGRIGKKDVSDVNIVPAGQYQAGDPGFGDSGSAARFFYCAKASRSERNAGLDKYELIRVELSHDNQTNGGKSWEKPDLNLLLLVDTERLTARVIGESTTTEDTEWNIESFGKNIMELSPTDFSFITKTEINSITISPILNYLIRLLTSDSIQDVNFVTANGGSPALIAEGCNQSLNITIGKTEYLPGVGNVVSGMWLRISGNDGNASENKCGKFSNFHSTVKPLALMEYLVRLTKTPTGGIVLDPFMGSGTTGCACVTEGRSFVGIEMEEEYFEIAKARIQYYVDKPKQLKLI